MDNASKISLKKMSIPPITALAAIYPIIFLHLTDFVKTDGLMFHLEDASKLIKTIFVIVKLMPSFFEKAMLTL